MSFLEVQHLTAGYGKDPILEDVSFSVPAGTLTGILGANGSGKTTLLKAICGILPHKGQCLLEDAPLEGLSPRKLAQRCSYIPQRSPIWVCCSAPRRRCALPPAGCWSGWASPDGRRTTI